jgi:phage gp45-like
MVNLTPVEAVIFESGNEKIVLTKGSKVHVVIDNTDFEKEYVGHIEFVNVDGIELENSPMMNWEYVESVTILGE